MALPEIPELQPVDNTYYPYDIAVIVDNVVYQVMNVSGQNAAILINQPTFVQVDGTAVREGYTYDPATGTFTAPTA